MALLLRISRLTLLTFCIAAAGFAQSDSTTLTELEVTQVKLNQSQSANIQLRIQLVQHEYQVLVETQRVLQTQHTDLIERIAKAHKVDLTKYTFNEDKLVFVAKAPEKPK